MENLKLGALLILLLLNGPPAEAKLKKWNQNMQELAKTVTDLLPQLADSQPVTPASQRKLEQGAKKLLKLVHTVNMGPGTTGNPLPPDSDPTLGMVSNLLEREVKSGYEAIAAGNTAYGRAVLRTVTGYCIACHTRHDQGPDFPSFHLEAKTKSLTPLQKAELLTATRNFDAALNEFEALAADKNFVKAKPFEWAQAVNKGLTIAIRVKKDPDRTLALLEKIAALPETPEFYIGNLPAWKKSVQQWKSELPKRINTEEGLFMEAARLSKEAQEVQNFQLDHSADILYLRSSAVLHELLSKHPHGARTSEAYLLIGTAYDLLGESFIWPLPQLYYEMCVRKSPHSEIAEQCYRRFEQDILFGYTGSGGTFVPNDMQALMKELRVLARVKK